jgi:20S proteasome alpha/beta subunit
MQFYASPEQVQRDRSEYARKGIARGRSAVVQTYSGGVLFVAENLTSLRKISEIYDRIGFAAVGRYNEFENLRRAGVRMADLNGFSYDRRDVTGRGIANAYTQTLGGDLRRAGRRLTGAGRAVPDHLRRVGQRRAGFHGDGRAGRGDLQRAAVAARRQRLAQ